MEHLNIPIKTVGDDVYHTEVNNTVSKINELVDAVSWENNNKLRIEPSDGHLYLDYTIGQMANFSIDNNGHLILMQ